MGKSEGRLEGRDAIAASPGTAINAAPGTSGKSSEKELRPTRMQRTAPAHPRHSSFSQPPTPPPTELHLINDSHVSQSFLKSPRNSSRTVSPSKANAGRAVNSAGSKLSQNSSLAHLPPRLRAAVVTLSAQRAVERARVVTARVSRLRAAVDRLLARSPSNYTASPPSVTSSSAGSSTRMRLKHEPSRQKSSQHSSSARRTTRTTDSQGSSFSRGSRGPCMRKPLPPPARPEHLRSALTTTPRKTASPAPSRLSNAPTSPPPPPPPPPVLPAAQCPQLSAATPPSPQRHWTTQRLSGAQPLLPALMRAEKNASMAPELQELRCALQQYTWHGPYSARKIPSKRTYASRTFPTPSAQFELAKVEGIWASPSSYYRRPSPRVGSPVSDL